MITKVSFTVDCRGEQRFQRVVRSEPLMCSVSEKKRPEKKERQHVCFVPSPLAYFSKLLYVRDGAPGNIAVDINFFSIHSALRCPEAAIRKQRERSSETETLQQNIDEYDNTEE